MSEAGPKRGLKTYLATLVATVLFPVLWMQALRMARRHADADPRARAKVLAAIAASIAIGLVGAFLVLGFLAGATAGLYKSLDDRLAAASGESEYQEQLTIISTATTALPTVGANLAKAQSDLANRTAINGTEPSAANPASMEKARANVTKLQETQVQMQADLATATARRDELADNHEQYLRVQDATADQDDARIRSLMAAMPAFGEASGSPFPKYKDLQANTDAAFAKKAESADQMRTFAWLFLWPSVAGAFFAPLAFAFGSILKRAFVESDTVGFKPYPGAAAGLFLLLGAFGLPSVLFAAWVFSDAFGRSEEGQISL